MELSEERATAAVTLKVKYNFANEPVSAETERVPCKRSTPYP